MKPAHYKLAEKDIGMKEIKGRRHNKKVLSMFKDVGHDEIDNDETSWCAAAVGSWLERAGIPGTGSLAARSYQKWGFGVELADAKPGDVVVFWRVDPNSWQGHVGLYVSHNDTHVQVLGGNQSNQVKISNYPVDRLLAVRRAPGQSAPTKSGRKFTQAFIKQIAPRASSTVIRDLDKHLNEILPRYKINNPKRIALFLANILTETGGFKTLEENMNYSAKRLTQVWPSRFKTERAARPYARNPEKLANKVYDRFGNKGHPGYGWKYRGSGFMQTTFVNNFQMVKDVTGLDVVKNPHLLRLDNKIALEAAAVFWDKKGLNALADRGSIKQVRKIINGGSHGIRSVTSYYKKILPLVQGFDLSNTVGKVGTGTVGTGGAIAATEGSWTGLMVFGLAVAALIAFIVYKKRKDKKDVEQALKQIEGVENLPHQHVLDLAGGSPVDRAGYIAALDELEYNPVASS